MPSSLPPVRPGDPFSARDRNRVIEAVRRGGLLRTGAGLVARQFGNGRGIARINEFERTRIKLTGGYSAGYPWKEVVRSGGGWVDTGRTGSAALDPAFELNDDTSLTSGSTVYWAQRSVTSGQWIFWRIGGGPSGGPNTCICAEGMPDTLTWTCQMSYVGTYLGTTTGSMAYMSDVRSIDSCFSFAVDGDGNPIPGWVGTFKQWGVVHLETGGIGGGAEEGSPEWTPFLFDNCYVPATVPAGYTAPLPGFCQWIVLLCSAPAGYGQLMLVKHNTSGGTTCTITEDFICVSDATSITCSPFLAAVTPTGSCVYGDYLHVTA